jgi:hypothetical protein
VEAAARHLVELRHPVGQHGRIVVGQAVDASAEHDVFGAAQCLGDEQVRRRNVLPGRGQVLADPGLAEAEPIQEYDLVEIFGQRVGKRYFGWVKRHGEVAVTHPDPQSA